jgi:hypothetical protein
MLRQVCDAGQRGSEGQSPPIAHCLAIYPVTWRLDSNDSFALKGRRHAPLLHVVTMALRDLLKQGRIQRMPAAEGAIMLMIAPSMLTLWLTRHELSRICSAALEA